MSIFLLNSLLFSISLKEPFVYWENQPFIVNLTNIFTNSSFSIVCGCFDTEKFNMSIVRIIDLFPSLHLSFGSHFLTNDETITN